MACLPNTPIAYNLLSATNSIDIGWIDLTAVTNNALSQYYPLSTAVMSFDGLAQTTNQHVIVKQIEIEETASSSANIKKCPLLFYLFNNTSPGSPTLGAVYNPTTTNLMGSFEIAAADYVRVSDTVWVAKVSPNRIIRTVVNSNASNFYGVLISNNGTTTTYAASAAIRVKVITEAATAL